MNLRCPQGHESTESDYCSVCGMAMGPAAAPTAVATAAPSAAAAAPAGTSCPVCGELRTDPDARYCEVCRYDFVAGAQGPPPVVAEPASAPAPQAVGPQQPPAAAPGGSAMEPAGTAELPANAAPVAGRWEAVVSVDPSLDVDPDPAVPVPAGEPERIFHIDLPETLIGRRDDRRDIRPEIPLHDPGVSHRHAKLLQQPDGGLSVLDLASVNGTCVNGAEIPAGEPHTLQEGDALTLGRWTRIVLRSRS